MWAVLSHPDSRGGADSGRRNLYALLLPGGVYALCEMQNADSLSGLFCCSLFSFFLAMTLECLPSLGALVRAEAKGPWQEKEAGRP